MLHESLYLLLPFVEMGGQGRRRRPHESLRRRGEHCKHGHAAAHDGGSPKGHIVIYYTFTVMRYSERQRVACRMVL